MKFLQKMDKNWMIRILLLLILVGLGIFYFMRMKEGFQEKVVPAAVVATTAAGSTATGSTAKSIFQQGESCTIGNGKGLTVAGKTLYCCGSTSQSLKWNSSKCSNLRWAVQRNTQKYSTKIS